MVTGVQTCALPIFLVAIVKKRLRLPASLYQILQILSLTLFEKTPMEQLLSHAVADQIDADSAKQLSLFN